MNKAIRNVALSLALAAAILPAGLHFAAAQDKGKDKDKGKDTKAAVFELYKDSGGEFRFRLKDDEGTLLATSGKGYKTKGECQKVIETIKRDAAKAKFDDQAK
jgi:uncharacterized protein YegP (UPF0339 family)